MELEIERVISQNTNEFGPVKAHHHSTLLMGCHFVITAVARNPDIAWRAIHKATEEITRIEDLISSWKRDSETGHINANAGIRPTKVSKELFDLISRSQRISALTSGAFDISGTLSRDYWKFDKGNHDILSDLKINRLRELIDFRNIQLDPNTSEVFLKKQGMKIGFGAIGKGYAAHRAQLVMQALGIEAGLINASGDLAFWGRPPGKEHWDINIPDPANPTHPLLTIGLPYGSVVTSGSYENYTMIDGRRYSHIIDPRTGLPTTSIKSVSVICPNPELADALATALSVMGHTEGIPLINKLNGVECIIIDDNDDYHYSQNLINNQNKNFSA